MAQRSLASDTLALPRYAPGGSKENGLGLSLADISDVESLGWGVCRGNTNHRCHSTVDSLVEKEVALGHGPGLTFLSV